MAAVVGLSCSSITCRYSNLTAALAPACTTRLGVPVTYTINGQQAVSSTCPDPGSAVSVVATVEGLDGACNYPGPTFTVTCEQDLHEGGLLVAARRASS